MKFEEWLSQQDGVIEVDCGCVTTEAFYHWMRVAYDGGAAASFWGGLFEEIKGRGSPHPGDFTPPTDMSVEDIIDALNNMQQEKRIADAVELLKKAAPAMLADNGGPDGPLAGRLKSSVIPEGYVMVPMRLTAENGAKGALSGAFSETKFVNCPECFGDDECETCDGSGRIEITVPVTWTTIKEIWAKGVEHFAAAPQEVKGE